MPVPEAPFRSFVEEILDGLAHTPEREKIVGEETRLTGARALDLVHRTARALRDLGVDRGTTVALLGDNEPHLMTTRYAANLLGAAVTQPHLGLAADTQARILADADTGVLVAAAPAVDRAAALTRLTPIPTTLVLGPVPPTAPPGALDLLALARDRDPAPLASRARPEDVCAIRHTGGTTGTPKSIRTTFGRVRLAGLVRRFFGDTVPRDLVCTPLAHLAGHMADLALAAGGTVILQPSFDPGAVLAAVAREGVTHTFLLPPLLYRLLDHPDLDRTDTSTLRLINYGGTPAAPARVAQAVRRFGPILQQGYGQAEAGSVSVLTPAEHDPDRPDLLGSAGRLLPGVDVEIRDPEGRPLPPGEVGEICVRSAQTMPGYWRAPEATARVLRDGWIHTGDLGRLDDGDLLTLVDRAHDVIVVVGGHVYPTEVERLLDGVPGVRESAVYGVVDEDRVERVHVTAALTPGSAQTPDTLAALIRDRLGATHDPHRVDLVDALPLTPTGKPDKRELRRRARANP
ncbi:AMP-binding protein [Streptomyces sp. BI20]|uniref:AMP-binding protein n=1 Tax=Streptomyces sp. BI20 TaxID=3403460 RepID=UPI003C733F20